jgi:hypothetical protein
VADIYSQKRGSNHKLKRKKPKTGTETPAESKKARRVHNKGQAFTG